jgi:hypothetical protein
MKFWIPRVGGILEASAPARFQLIGFDIRTPMSSAVDTATVGKKPNQTPKQPSGVVRFAILATFLQIIPLSLPI